MEIPIHPITDSWKLIWNLSISFFFSYFPPENMSTVTATTTGTTTSFGSQLIWSVNSGDLLRNVAIAFTVLETIAVALRFASLRLTKKQFGVDDFLTIPGYICCLGLPILAFGIVTLI